MSLNRLVGESPIQLLPVAPRVVVGGGGGAEGEAQVCRLPSRVGDGLTVLGLEASHCCWV